MWHARRSPINVLNKRNNDKNTSHIQKFQQGGENDGKELASVLYSGVANDIDNLVGEKNESKEIRAAQEKGRHTGSRFGQGMYKPNYNI